MEWKGRVRQVGRGWDRRITRDQEKRGPGLPAVPRVKPRKFRERTLAKRSYVVKVNLLYLQRSVESGRSKNGAGNQICWPFQRPRLKRTMPAAAMAASAMTMDQKTPLERMRTVMARK